MTEQGNQAGLPGGRSKKPGDGQEEFQIVRSTAPEPGGSPVGSIVAIVVVLILAGVGYGIFSSSGDGDASPTPTNGADNGTTPVPTESVDTSMDVELPPEIAGRLDFLEGEGRFEEALDAAEENLELFPCQELRERIAEYQRKLGKRPIPELLAEAEAQVQAKKFQEALKTLELVLEQNEEHARALFLSGVAKGMTGDPLGAVTDLENSIEFGHPEEPARKLIEQFEK